MDAKLIFWSAALANMAVLVALILRGVRQVRRGEVEAHRRSMLTAASLVGAFVLAYLLKLAFLGREDLDRWSDGAVLLLRIHEACIAVMLLGGGTAGWAAWKFRRGRTARLVSRHRWAGRAAVAGAVTGLLTACLVLAAMARQP